MINITQKGFAPVLVLLVLLLIGGVVLGVYLVKNQTFFTPSASVSGPIYPEVSLELRDAPPPHPVGSNIAVKILIRSDFDAANQFVAKIKFPQNLLNVVSLDTTAEASGSAEVYPVNSWLEEFYDNTTGEISLVGGVPDPGLKTDPNSQTQYVMATINFKGMAEGNAYLDFLNESAIYRNSDNVNILVLRRSVTIPITAALQSVSPSPSATPDMDSDYDKFTDSQEIFMGTNPKKACPIDKVDAAWPPDVNNDTFINGGDVSTMVPYINGTKAYDKRYDLNQDGKITESDVTVMQQWMLASCTPVTATPTPTPITSPVVTPTPFPACGVSCNDDSQCAGAKDGCTSCLSGSNTSTKACMPKPSPTASPCSTFLSAVNTVTSLVGISTCPTPTPTPTSTPSPSPTPVPVACNPRPNFVRSTTMTSGGLLVVLNSTTNAGTTSNSIMSMKFTALTNAKLVIGGKTYSQPVSLVLPSGTTRFEFLIQQVTFGQSTTVQMAAVDTCGDYPLFFGGGTGAGWPDPTVVLPEPSPFSSAGIAVASPRPSGDRTNTTSSCVGYSLGDGNKDSSLDLRDSSNLLSKMGKDINDCTDMNADGKINVIDLSLLRKLFIDKAIIRIKS